MKASMTPSDFIRSMPIDWTAKQVWEEGQKQGIHFSRGLTNVVRNTDAKKKKIAIAQRETPEPEPQRKKAPRTRSQKASRKSKTAEGIDKTQALLAFCAGFIKKHGRGPNLPTIREEGGFAASGLGSALARLKAQGFLVWNKGDYASMRLGRRMQNGSVPHPLPTAPASWPPLLPPAAERGFEPLIAQLRSAARIVLGNAALAGEDVSESAKTFGRVIEILRAYKEDAAAPVLTESDGSS